MVERNMIREGFIVNTATSPSNPTFSGSQIVNENQMSSLADGNISIAAITVSATENIDITADLGARWKLDRLELYTDDSTNANITMETSDNNVDFTLVTMTGSPNLYVGDIPDSTISGAPRYIRYRHTAVGAVDVLEWKAVNDETLVDFGADGNQTQVEIADAPVGRVSDSVQNLKLFNKFNKPGTAFVFIDNTGNDADDLFEISSSTLGPWSSRKVSESLQPANTPWASGTSNGTRNVTASGYYLSWFQESSEMSWELTDSNFTAFTVDPNFGGSVSFQSTGVAPRYRSSSDYTEGPSPWQNFAAGLGNIHAPHPRNVIVDTALYDRVRVRLKVDPLVPSDVVEGPRIRWRAIDDINSVDPFPIENSSLSQFAFNNFTGQVQDFIFDVSQVTTWSGTPFNTIRGLEITPFITATGIGSSWDLYEIEVFNSSLQDRIVLDRQPTQSGTRPDFVNDGLTTFFSPNFPTAHLVMNTRITRPCIITKVSVMTAAVASNYGGVFLFRFTPNSGNFNFPGIEPIVGNPGTPGSASGDNFEVVGTCQFNLLNGGTGFSTNENWVFWRAEPGDMLGISREQNSIFWRAPFKPDTSVSSPAAYYSDDRSGWGNIQIDMESNADCQADLNAQDTWQAQDDVMFQLWCDTVPITGYLANGTYTSPIFDGAIQPALLSSSFVSIEEGNSSIDSNTSSAFKTIRARASDSPPLSSPEIGEIFNSDSFLWGSGPREQYPLGQAPTDRGTFPVRKWINEDIEPSADDWLINHQNGFITNREFLSSSNSIRNLGGAMLYHEDKDELWVMNVLISGTAPNDLRPIWNVYDPSTLDYVRTDHLKGQISYSYTSGLASLPEIFEPVGFIYDPEFSEIHIVQRENYIFIGTNTYYGITMDLEGNYKRATFREDSIGGTTTRWNGINSLTFDGTYFYALTTNSIGSTGIGDFLSIIKRGDVQTGDNELISEIETIDLSSVVGLTGADGDPRGQQCIYNPVDGIIYLFFGNPLDSSDDFANRKPEMYALKLIIDSADVLQSAVKIDLVDPWGISSIDGVRLSELGQQRDSYLGNSAVSTDDTQLITDRGLNFLSASCYDSKRDVYNIISSHRTEFFDDWDARNNQFALNNFLYDGKTIQMFFAFSANSFSPTYGQTPIRPLNSDANWGALSGTLAWESLQQNSVLFPTGRYAQLEYTLNSSSDFITTPQLITSQLNQGIRIGGIPASGTTDVYLRTNLPEDQPIGDLASGLKVFWELPE